MTRDQVSLFVSTGPCPSEKYPQAVLQAVVHGEVTVMTAVCVKTAVGEINPDLCPVPQKASTSSSSPPLLLGLALGMFHRINFTYRCILFYIDFSYKRKLRIKLAKTDLLTLLNEARVD